MTLRVICARCKTRIPWSYERRTYLTIEHSGMWSFSKTFRLTDRKIIAECGIHGKRVVKANKYPIDDAVDNSGGPILTLTVCTRWHRHGHSWFPALNLFVEPKHE